MAAPQTSPSWSPRKLLIAAVLLAAIVGASTGLAAGLLARPSPGTQSREFYVFPNELPFNNTLAGIPHYVFIPDRIVVNKGDTVIIHFYQFTDESHTFTMQGPYSVDKVLPVASSTNIPRTDISFVASTPGIFTYHCRFHPPTMTGTLVVQS